VTSRDFCFWLQGFFELGGAGDLPATGPETLSPKQVAAIKAHLALVFKHEIDPSAGGPEHQAALNEIHATPDPAHHVGGTGVGGIVLRC